MPTLLLFSRLRGSSGSWPLSYPRAHEKYLGCHDSQPHGGTYSRVAASWIGLGRPPLETGPCYPVDGGGLEWISKRQLAVRVSRPRRVLDCRYRRVVSDDPRVRWPPRTNTMSTAPHVGSDEYQHPHDDEAEQGHLADRD